jgi:hypothetical protein
MPLSDDPAMTSRMAMKIGVTPKIYLIVISGLSSNLLERSLCSGSSCTVGVKISSLDIRDAVSGEKNGKLACVVVALPPGGGVFLPYMGLKQGGTEND